MSTTSSDPKLVRPKSAAAPATEGADRSDHRPAGRGRSFRVRFSRLSPMQALAVARERRLWNLRARSWDDAGSSGLDQVVQAVVDECRVAPDGLAVDLGAGSGAVTLPLARSSRQVLAVDVSEQLLGLLEKKAAEEGVQNVEVLASPIEGLSLAPQSIDLIVSNYALHHLRDADKTRLLEQSHSWLKPGGRLVIGDMMFGRAVNTENRQIFISKAAVFLRRGPAGWFRLLKNLARFALRLGEKPLPPETWETLAREAGYEQVTVNRIRSEACVLVAVKGQG